MFRRGFINAAAFVSLVLPVVAAFSSASAQVVQSAAPAGGASPQPSASPTPKPERFSFHAQSTNTQQYHGSFRAAYSGPESLDSKPDTAKTIFADFFVGARLWRGGAFYLTPELDQGFALGHPRPPGMPYFGTIGAAGFFNGGGYKVGRDSSYERIQRAFVRQTVDLGGGEPVTIDPDINQLGGSITPKHLIVTAGKFSVTDVFDNNTYAHDPTNDFLNWTIIDMGSFDYAADAWGFTYGASAELADARSTLRAGLFQLSLQPNQIPIESVPFRQFSPILEFERRTSFFGAHPGAMKALVYEDDGYMGPYAAAIAAAAGTGSPPNTASVRQAKHIKAGAGINLAQEIAPNIGVFARLSAMNGTYEAFEFTDVDRSASAGVSVSGDLYHRPDDTFGLAGALNGISNPAKQYFAAGGLGIVVGDGALSYSGERILETYYKAGFTKHFGLTFDYQYVVNPAYNTRRGPVSVYGLRYHAQI
jgi:high affinity Mn2+ porin